MKAKPWIRVLKFVWKANPKPQLIFGNHATNDCSACYRPKCKATAPTSQVFFKYLLCPLLQDGRAPDGVPDAGLAAVEADSLSAATLAAVQAGAGGPKESSS